MGVIIRKMVAEDLDRIMEIEEKAFTTPWTRESFILEITKNQLAKYIVAEIDNRVVGYGGIWLILDEGHITNIAVDTDYRKMGAGNKLVEGLISLCVEHKISAMTLEVRESNIAAKSLYKKFDFIESGVRPKYYADDNEDAIIMWKNL